MLSIPNRILPAAWAIFMAAGVQAAAQQVEVHNHSGQAMEIERLEEGKDEPAVAAYLLPPGRMELTKFDFPVAKGSRTLPEGGTLLMRYRDRPVVHEPAASRAARFRIIDGNGNPRIFYFSQWTEAPAGAGAGPEIAVSLHLESAPRETKGTPAGFTATDKILTLTPASGTAAPKGEYLLVNQSGAELEITPDGAGPLMSAALEQPGAQAKAVDLAAPVRLGHGASLRLKFRQTPAQARQLSLTGSLLIAGEAAVHCIAWESRTPDLPPKELRIGAGFP